MKKKASVRFPSSLIQLGLLILLAGVAGCGFRRMATVTRLSQLGRNETVVVGRVELVPPLREEEQDIKLIGPYNDKNQYFFMVGRKWVDKRGELSGGDYDAVIIEKFGTTFYVKAPARPLFLLRYLIYMQVTVQGMEKVWLPGGVVVDIQAGDRAVYMGTLRYHRNEFFDLSRIEIVDDYAREKQVFEKRFGRNIPLVKRLPRPVKSQP